MSNFDFRLLKQKRPYLNVIKNKCFWNCIFTRILLEKKGGLFLITKILFPISLSTTNKCYFSCFKSLYNDTIPFTMRSDYKYSIPQLPFVRKFVKQQNTL